MTPAQTAQKLREAADLIEPEGAWTQGEMARLPSMRPVGVENLDAVCFCMVGAMHRMQVPSKGFSAVQKTCGGLIWQFNDSGTRTQAECVAALRAAADAVEAGA